MLPSVLFLGSPGHDKVAKRANMTSKQSQGPPCPLSMYNIDSLKHSLDSVFFSSSSSSFFLGNEIPQTQKSGTFVPDLKCHLQQSPHFLVSKKSSFIKVVDLADDDGRDS